MIEVRYTPQYTPCANKTIISGYLVYEYVGHPLLGKIKDSETIVKTKGEALRLTRKIRKALNYYQSGSRTY